ncbi:MAG: phosphoribosylaminoimidazolesuccinocarboxamide synthase [Patescibacteria group bacterium]|nr:phosphoribosylaminoimidazolesuccinocarboxamide synthase [Patescibacteria group bacterium]
MNEQAIRQAITDCIVLNNCLSNTDFLGFPNGKKGKVRDIYDLGDQLLLITTDRQSAFDRLLANVPFKGAVLNQTSAYWFGATEDIVPNHVISISDPNAILAKKCRVIPIEFVIRGYLTGSTDTSAWTLYAKGGREMCGNILPDGMVKNQKFAKPIITPTTKSEEHDESISPAEIVARKIVSRETWDGLEKIAFKLFDRGVEIAAMRGLILVDTKYEFGIDRDGQITLIDEIHTPDSSRYWLADSYAERLAAGREPENIDKEFLRLWFKQNCDPYHDQELPEAPADLVEELSFRYIKLYEMITGRNFNAASDFSVRERLKKNLSGIL